MNAKYLRESFCPLSPKEAVKKCLAPKGRHNVAQGASPGIGCPKTHKTIYLSALSQGLRPGLRYVAPSGLKAFFHSFKGARGE